MVGQAPVDMRRREAGASAGLALVFMRETGASAGVYAWPPRARRWWICAPRWEAGAVDSGGYFWAPGKAGTATGRTWVGLGYRRRASVFASTRALG